MFVQLGAFNYGNYSGSLYQEGDYIIIIIIIADNSSIGRVEEFKYLGTTLSNQNSFQEEIKSRLKLGNACYRSVQNLLSSTLLSKNLKNKNYNFACCFEWK